MRRAVRSARATSAGERKVDESDVRRRPALSACAAPAAGHRTDDARLVFVRSAMAIREPTDVVLSLAQRDAIFADIDFTFESARDLPLMLEHGVERVGDRIDVRELIWRLQVAVRLLDQLGWQRSGNRAGYVLEVDADISRFAAGLERHALGALEDDRHGLFAEDKELRAMARELLDSDLDALQAARLVQATYQDDD
jgi:hypothetical protein